MPTLPVPIGNIRGPSAYDVAVAHGYAGTEAEWIAELSGGGAGGDVSAQIATALEEFVGLAPAALDTWAELVAKFAADDSALAALTTTIGGKASLAALHAVALSGAYGDLTGRPVLAPVATSGLYGDLTGRPTVPTTPGQVGADAAGAATAAANAAAAALAAHEADTTAIHGIANTAVLETVTGAQAKVDAAIAALIGAAPGTLDTWAELVSAIQADQSGLAALTSLVNTKATLATLATVATTGSYADLSGRPAIPADLGAIADTANRLAMTAVERAKLAGIAAGATANATDAQLRDRSTHSGTQTLATISDAGTAAAKNTGTAAGEIPVLGAGGVLAIGRIASGAPTGTKFVRDDGTLAVPAGGGGSSFSGTDVKPAGAAYQTYPRWAVSAGFTAGSGVLTMAGIHLPAGASASAIRFKSSSTASTGLTHSWAGLFDANRVLLAISPDNTAAWLNLIERTFTFGAALSGLSEGDYYIGYTVVASTPTTMWSSAGNVNLMNQPTYVAATADTGMTTPPAVGFVAAALTPIANLAHASIIP